MCFSCRNLQKPELKKAADRARAKEARQQKPELKKAADRARAKEARQSHESRQAAFGAKMELINDAWFDEEAKYCFAADVGLPPAVIPTDPLRRVLLQPWSEEVPDGQDTPYVTPAWPLQGIA